MLKNRKIELQSKTLLRLKEENTRLATENKDLKQKIQEQKSLVQAAENYRDEQLKILQTLNESKEKYEKAVRDIMEMKKLYRKRFVQHNHLN